MVTPEFAGETVVSFSPIQRIFAVAAKDVVIPVATTERVVTARSKERVVVVAA